MDEPIQPESIDEKESKMADDVAGVLKEQVSDLKRQVANLEDIRSRNRTKIGSLKKDIEQLTKEHNEMFTELQERTEAQGDLDLLNKQIDEWSPIVDDYENVKTRVSDL